MWQDAVMRLAQLDKFLWGERKRSLVRWLYEGMATHYDWVVEHLTPDYQRAAEGLLDALQVAPQDTLLDLGCGTGMVTLPAAARVDRVIGLDLTPGMMRRLQRKARRHGLFRLLLVRGDALTIPLPDASLSVVTSSFMLPHLSPREKQRLFQEVCRVLVPRGRVGFLTSLPRFADTYLTEEEWRDGLTKAGFEDIRIEDAFDVYRIVTAHAAGPT